MPVKNWKKFISAIITAALCTALPAGCSEKKEVASGEKPYTIGVITKSKTSEYWMTVYSGMEKAAKDYGVSVLVVSPDTETNDRLQKKMIEDLIIKGVDALAISPIQSYDVDDYLEKAREREIPVFAYDTRIMNHNIPYIGIDNKKAGRDLAQYMAEQIGHEGQVGIITGDLNQTAHDERMKGFRSYIEEHTSIEISFLESGYSNLQMSEKEISRLMEKHPGIDGIFATSAVTALGIMDYMREQPVLIVTVDAQQDAIEAVKDGGIAALAAQSGYDIGYETIRYILEHKGKKGERDDKILKAEIVTKDNIAGWKD